MVSRRVVLRTAGAATLAAVAGCSSSGDDGPATTERTDAGDTEQTTDDGPAASILAAEQVTPSSVPDGARLGVATPELHELIADAASADERVDLEPSGNADPDVTLALGQFECVEFRGETYEPTASFARAESTEEFSLEPVDDGDVDEGDEVVTYESLSDTEQAVADRLRNESITVGPHEQGRPDGVSGVVAPEYLRVGNDTYQPRIVIGDHPPHHALRLDSAEPPADAQVVVLADRRPELAWKDTLTSALPDGSAELPDTTSGESLRTYVADVDYLAGVAAVAEVGVVEEVA
ncbi:hypothetical protein [Halobacterium yunchengense]|uniref:hypothetical protein n=1 Tax=Halobacterium yunchengense TaxID=3108497 RepID=UPI00300ABA10